MKRVSTSDAFPDPFVLVYCKVDRFVPRGSSREMEEVECEVHVNVIVLFIIILVSHCADKTNL